MYLFPALWRLPQRDHFAGVDGEVEERLVLFFRTSLEWADFLNPSHHGGLNDAGELVFSVELDGYGSGLYKATLPEPGAGVSMLAALSALAVLRARKTRRPYPCSLP